MAIKKYWNFADEGSVPADFTEIEGGNGAVSIASDHLRITPGGTGSGDYAAAVFDTALDSSKLTIIYAEVKMSGTVGAWVPNIVGLFDSASEPGAMTAANRDAALRIWQEYQMSSGADSFDRIQLRMKEQGAGAHWQYIAGTRTWQSTFAYTRAYYDEDSYYRFVIVFDGTTSPKKARLLVYGTPEDLSNAGGDWVLNYDSEWVDFDTNSGDIDPIDNSLWVILEDPTNDEAKNNVTFDYRRVMIGEIDTVNPAEFAFSNRSTASGANYQYELIKRFNPMPDDQTLWVPRDPLKEVTVHTPDIARGTDEYVKDPYCFFDGTTYWLFYQRDNAGEGEMNVSSATDIINGSWASETVISQPDTGEDKHEFPWVTKYSGTWYMFYGIEEDAGTWEIQYKTTTATNPTSGWSSATTILTKGAASDWDEDGVTQPVLIWHSGTFAGGTWYMLFAGVNGVVWKGGLAKSTTGITGTYTKDGSNPILIPGTFSTQVSGAHADQMTITVDSTTGLSAGAVLIEGDVPWYPIEVLSVDSGTTFSVGMETSLSDNDDLTEFATNSVVPRVARRIGGYWIIYVTSFKYSGGQEAVSIYVDTTGEIALEDCTFRELRYGDAPIDLVVPSWDIDLISSDENFGSVFAELSPVVETTALLINISPDANYVQVV